MKFFAAAFVFAFLGMFAGRADDVAALQQPLRTVTAQYLVIEQKLAADSFDGVPAAAAEMKKAVDADTTKFFAPEFGPAVNQLAAAKSLHEARVALQPVSSGLIETLALKRIQTGALHAVFCPMVKAYWVQADGKTVRNPYLGSEMLDCGTFGKQF